MRWSQKSWNEPADANSSFSVRKGIAYQAITLALIGLTITSCNIHRESKERQSAMSYARKQADKAGDNDGYTSRMEWGRVYDSLGLKMPKQNFGYDLTNEQLYNAGKNLETTLEAIE